jgi:hypothetical protein
MGTAVIDISNRYLEWGATDIVMHIVDSKTMVGYNHYCFVGSGLFRRRNGLCHHEEASSYRAL